MSGSTSPDSPTAPDPAPTRALVVKVTCGREAAERSNQALTVAATACAAGAEVSLWLAGEATWFAVAARPGTERPGTERPDIGRPDPGPLAHAAPATDLVDAVLAGGTVTVCTQCARRRGLTGEELLPGVRVAGAASYVEEILRPQVQALVY